MHRVYLIIRIFVLILILPLLALILTPSAKINAQCSGTVGTKIIVDNGLVSTIDLGGILGPGSNPCISGQGVATIPPWSIPTYDSMKILYFDQVKSTYEPITITGNATQNSDSLPINFKTITN